MYTWMFRSGITSNILANTNVCNILQNYVQVSVTLCFEIVPCSLTFSLSSACTMVFVSLKLFACLWTCLLTWKMVLENLEILAKFNKYWKNDMKPGLVATKNSPLLVTVERKDSYIFCSKNSKGCI